MPRLDAVDSEFQRKSSINQFCSVYEDLPYVAVTRILSHLNFREKLNAVKIFESWEPYLCAFESWPELMYNDQKATRIWDRQEVCLCMRKYGKYIRKIKLNFHYHVRTSGTALLSKIATYCPQLKYIQMIEADFDADRPFKNILDVCKELKHISIVRPWVDWSHEENIVSLITKPKNAGNLVEFVAVPETTYPEYDIGKALNPSMLTSLNTLKVKRSFLPEDKLLSLVSHQLKHLSVFQDEDLPLDQPVMYSEVAWDKVLTKRSNFCFHAALRNIIVLRTCFPSQAPLRALILADLMASLTKGILDTITTKFHATLETFVCTKSFAFESVDVEDKRLPEALVDLSEKCTRLHTLVYGFSITSASVLLLARTRKFSCLDIPLDIISYKFHRKHIKPEWSSEFVQWLKEASSTLDRLEDEVSSLLGYEWSISNEPRDRKIQHYFRYF